MPFREKIASKKFCITCEISPPRGPKTSEFEEKIKKLSGKVDAVNITDNPMLSVRMSPVGGAFFCLKNGVEPIMQITCRDRNILALTSELISAHALGVRNVLVLRGDLPKDDKPKGVFEVDVRGLLKLIYDLNNGVDFRGNKINEKCDFFVGAALNPFDEYIIQNLETKLSGGAKFFQTQPVFDVNSLDSFGKLVEEKKADVLLGVIIVSSEKTLESIKKFAKGIVIPEELEKSITKFEKKEDKEKVGVEFTLKLIEDIEKTKIFRGAHIYSPANENLIIELVKQRNS